MSEFNRMTIVAAAEVISSFKSHSDMEVLEVQWGIDDKCNTSNKSARVASWARIAVEKSPNVMTEAGRVPLTRGLIEIAIDAPPSSQNTGAWQRLLAGLRFDGFEVVEENVPSDLSSSWYSAEPVGRFVLQRMLPDDVPGLEFREAENEVVTLLQKHNLNVSKGHLNQAIAAFSRGEWAASNAQFRTFYEGFLDEIAVKLGCDESIDSKAKRRFLGELDSPFLYSEYNEWNRNDNKHQFVQGLMSRMHPHGSHSGLSEEDDCTFRMQITLITARLFLRRFDQRMS